MLIIAGTSVSAKQSGVSAMSMADRDGLIWFDGTMVPWREANIHVLTHTLHYGMGCFEGVRAYNAEQGTAIFALEAHTRRLFDSCKILGMEMPYTPQQINEAQIAAVRENNLESAYIRPMCFYGSEGMGLRADNLTVHCMVAAWEWGAYLGNEALEKGIRVKTSSYTRHHVNIAATKAKANGQYIKMLMTRPYFSTLKVMLLKAVVRIFSSFVME
jgi:branched-chain amino acid aminotransferase